jgi:hypothetical protein
MSNDGHPPTLFEHQSGLLLICIGHLYARRARSFSVMESLEILASEYLNAGINGVRAEIGGGMFSLLIIDMQKKCLIAFTDFLACMPLYHRDAPSGHLIGTNQFDLACDAPPSLLACSEYLAYGYLPFHQSLFPEVGRLGPGQVLTIQLDMPERFDLSEEHLPIYPALDQRISNEDEAIERMNALFTEYFSRLGPEPIAAGLSGGYDSRLIASYCRGKNIQLVTFDNPHTNEARYAQRAAQKIGLQTEVFQIPADSPFRYYDDFFFGTGTSDSFESSHVFANLDALCRSKPAFIIDGCFGDSIFGAGFYYKLKLQSEPIWKILIGDDTYSAGQFADDVYLKRMNSGYGRKNPGLPYDLASQVDLFAHDSLVELITKYRAYCASDADLIELLIFRFRGSLLVSGGPVTFMRRAPTLCPFYDEEIFKTCMRISKSLRAGDRLYNAFYRRCFPELAKVPKENTGGHADQNIFSYRMTHLKNASFRRIIKHLPRWTQNGASAGGSIDAFLGSYLNNRSNQEFFSDILSGAEDKLGKLGLKALAASALNESNQLFYLRYISLLFLLDHKEYHS